MITPTQPSRSSSKCPLLQEAFCNSSRIPDFSYTFTVPCAALYFSTELKHEIIKQHLTQILSVQLSFKISP